jgi:putative transcriptional regulator
VEAVQVKSRLRVLRAEREWTQGELAERLGVSRQTINAIETEKYEPSLSLAFKMARLFNRRIEEIFVPDSD